MSHDDHHHQHHHAHGGSWSDMEQLFQMYHNVFKDSKRTFIEDKVKIQKGWHVLEIGCGSCYNFDVWLNAVGEEGSLTLVEPDEGFGKYLEEKSKHHKNVKYIAKSLEESEPLCCFSKTGYNLVVLDNVYHHLSDVDTFFLILKKCLNPVGGKLLMFEAVFGTSRFITPVKNQYMEIQGKAIKHGYASQTANAPKQLELHGFQVVYNELIVKSTSDKESPLAILYRDGMHAMILSKDLEEKKRLQLWKEIWDNPQTVLFGDYTMYLLASIK